MSSAHAPVPIATLLAHRAWVRRLARSLVRDDAAADDVEQRTWLTALRSPPRHAGAARTWLARVVRSQALNAFRASGRRETHERAGARSESVRSAADVAAEAEIQERLAAAVLRLDAPYRETLLLRFFDDAPPREIAERMGVPVETVRTRLRRGLAILREGLTQDAGGTGWVAAFAPIAGLQLEPWAGTGAATTAPWVAAGTGGAVMAGKTALVVALGLGVAGGFVGGTLTTAASSDGSERTEPRRRLETERSGSGVAKGASPEAAQRVEDLIARTQAQDRRIAQLESALSAASRARPEAAAAPAVADPPAARGGADDAAVRALAEATAEMKRHNEIASMTDADREAKRRKELSDAALLDEIRRLMVTQWKDEPARTSGNETMLRASNALLARNPAAPERAEALTAKGVALRALSDLTGSEAALREGTEVGRGTDHGVSAAIQLAFTLRQKGDALPAAETMLAAGKDPVCNNAAYIRWMAAGMFQNAKDPARARAEFSAVIAEYETSDSPPHKHAVAEARKSLERMDGASPPR